MSGKLCLRSPGDLESSVRTIVAGGAGDVAAGGIGIGAVEDGDAFISVGTSAQFFVSDDRYRPQPGTLLHAFAHALPERWFRMAAMLNGASCLDFVARLVGKDIATLLERPRRTIADLRGCFSFRISPASERRTTIHLRAASSSGLDHDCGADGAHSGRHGRRRLLATGGAKSSWSLRA